VVSVARGAHVPRLRGDRRPADRGAGEEAGEVVNVGRNYARAANNNGRVTTSRAVLSVCRLASLAHAYRLRDQLVGLLLDQ
jgi:hypothetical protein